MNRKGTRAASLIEYFTVVVLFDLSLAMTARPGVPFFMQTHFSFLVEMKLKNTS